MNPTFRVVFFLFSLISMAGFAGSALLMADNLWGKGFLLLIVSVFFIGFGFMLRGRLLRQTRR